MESYFLPFLHLFATVNMLFFLKMQTTKENPMATKREEITHVLEGAGENDIEIVHRNNEMVIHIRIESKQVPSEPKKGKWAKVAEELSREAPLTGIGEEFLKHTKRFRKNFALKSPFSETE
jgi:hypothetical protein